jgi:chromosome condensin MukBEF complex kleisin-like MukF subunit
LNKLSSSKGSLLYLIEVAYSVMRIFGEMDLAERMKEQVLKCQTEKEIEDLLNQYYKKLDQINPTIKKTIN